MEYISFYISSLSKYFLGLFLILHSIAGYVCLFIDEESGLRNALMHARTVLMILFHVTAFGCICSMLKDPRAYVSFLVSLVLLFGILILGDIIYPEADKMLASNMCMLLSVGFVMLTRLSLAKSLKQLLIVTVSFILSMGVPYVIRKFRLLHTFKWIYASIGLAALGIVLIAGQLTYGANITYTIGGITFQPSEIIKLTFVFFTASCFVRARGMTEVLISASMAAAHVLILVLSHDLGSALIYGVVYMVMVFIATGNFLYVVGGCSGAALAGFLAYKRFAHVRTRIKAWLDPWTNIDNIGYQITQSLFAISSGSVWGLGLCKGNPTSIPFVEDDFIFSAIVEEMGAVCGIAILSICLLSFLTAFKYALQLKSMFYRLLSAGLGTAYAFQVFVTVGGGVRFIPLTGVTLPFVSYGGSSVLTSILLFEVLIGISMIRIDEQAFYGRIKEQDN